MNDALEFIYIPYRDHDELRYSMRSVLQHFHPNSNAEAPQFHLLASDLPAPACIPASNLRMGQAPQWINVTQPEVWKDKDTTLKVWNHAEVFDDYPASSFHSNAIGERLGQFGASYDKGLKLYIETQLTNIPGVSEYL